MLQIKRLRDVKCFLKYLSSETSCSIVRRGCHGIGEDVITLRIRGETLKFPHVWLRDNCQCEQCYHKTAKSRILDWNMFDVNRRPVEVRQDESSVNVTWDDGHLSRFNSDWLKFRSFSERDQTEYTRELYRPPKRTWRGEEFPEICARHDYKKIVVYDEALHRWLHDLSTYGVTLVRNAPGDESALDALVGRVGFAKRTHYGVRFVVQHVPDTSNVAYQSSNLQPHTDLPYYEHCPGVNLLHCLVQTESRGGENTLADCHYVAEYMRANHPEQYGLLADTQVEWRDVGVENGEEFHKLYRAPVVCLDGRGEVARINFSVPQRGSHFPGPIERVRPWYEAHSLFYELSRRFSATFKVEPGDILAFDNVRLLHGRNQYEDRDGNVRKLVGVYVDWDEIYSRLRCLKVKLYPRDCY
ncbi:unnamed protein product, partial [Iphiclides podalirius]